MCAVCVRYVELVLSMAGKVLGDDRGDYREACRALLLLKSVLNASKASKRPNNPPTRPSIHPFIHRRD